MPLCFCKSDKDLREQVVRDCTPLHPYARINGVNVSQVCFRRRGNILKCLKEFDLKMAQDKAIIWH